MVVNKRSETIGVRVADDVKSAVAAAASADNRSIASFVETLLIDHLISQGYLDANRNGRSPSPDGMCVGNNQRRWDRPG